MSATEDQARTGATLDAQDDAASRTFAHEPGEGEALLWIGMLATIKATKEQTGGQIRRPFARGDSTSLTNRHKAEAVRGPDRLAEFNGGLKS